MYILNITTNIKEAIEDKWLTWMMNTHIPEMVGTGLFFEAKLTRVMIKEEMGGVTYSTQYSAKSKEEIKAYYITYASEMHKKTEKEFSGEYVSFRTELEVIGTYGTPPKAELS